MVRAPGIHAVLLFVGNVLLCASCGSGGDRSPVHSPKATTTEVTREEATARTFLDELAHADWRHTKTAFTPAMTEAMTSEKVREVWQKLEGIAGRYGAVTSAKTEPNAEGTVVHLTCAFEHGEKIVRITVNEKREVAGMFYGPSVERLESRTRSLIDKANSGDFAGASVAFGSVMRNALPPADFEAAWRSVEAQAGRLETIEKVTLKSAGDVSFSLAAARCQKTNLLVKVVYDERDEVVGLFFLPPEVPWTPPAYANQDAIVESDVQVGSQPALPATLTMPRGASTVPAVVLVHGSGPSDRDESVGAIKVFKDLSLGLAGRGIAVLRYEKRSRHSPSGIVTEKKVLDGAHDAIELLLRTPQVDPRRIFILGHSQGGNLAPRIAKANPGAEGQVIDPDVHSPAGEEPHPSEKLSRTCESVPPSSTSGPRHSGPPSRDGLAERA